MKNLVLHNLIVMFIFITSSGLLFAQDNVQTHFISIRKIDKVWRVVDSNDSTKTQIVVKQGDRVVWKPVKTPVVFQFMDNRLAGVFTRAVESGKTFQIKIPARFPKGSYPYAVFCLADNVFAIGNSPPVIIVE